MSAAAKAVAWPQDRRDEIGKLQQMLYKLRGLNNGSAFLQHVGECIDEAEALLNSDLINGRPSFVSFLIADACRPVDLTGELAAAEGRISDLAFALRHVLVCEVAAINGCSSRSNLSGKNVEERVAIVSAAFDRAKRALAQPKSPEATS